MATPQRTMSKWVAGSRSVAALFAAWIVISGWRSFAGLRNRAETLELLVHERLVVVGGREVGPDPGELHPLVGGDCVDQRGRPRPGRAGRAAPCPSRA